MKVEFSKYVGWKETEEEIFEFEDDATEEYIQKVFEEWVWEDIGDNYNWKKIPDTKEAKKQ